MCMLKSSLPFALLASSLALTSRFVQRILGISYNRLHVDVESVR